MFSRVEWADSRDLEDKNIGTCTRKNQVRVHPDPSVECMHSRKQNETAKVASTLIGEVGGTACSACVRSLHICDCRSQDSGGSVGGSDPARYLCGCSCSVSLIAFR